MLSKEHEELDAAGNKITKDADPENKNSDEDEEEEFDFEEDEDEDDPDEEDDEPSEDDDKPITKKELRDILKSNQNKDNASRRISKKDRPITKQPKQNERLDGIEASLKKQELLERKRQFGYENDLSPKEVDMVFRVTKRPTRAILNDPFIKGGLEKLRQTQSVRGNTPGSSPAATKFAGKEWGELEHKDKQANFADRRRAILESKRKR